MNVHALLPFICSAIFIISGLTVYFLDKDDVRKPYLKLCYVTFHWQFSWFILFSIGNESNGMLITRIGYSGIIFIPAAFYELICAYLNKKSRAIKHFYMICTVFLITLWTSDLFIEGFYKTGFGYYPRAGILHLVYLALIVFIMSRCVLLFNQRSKVWKNKADSYYSTLFYSGMIVYTGSSIDFTLNYPDILSKFNISLYPCGALFNILAVLMFLIAHKERLNLYLEQKVEERTEELQKSLVLLKEAQEDKKYFVASLSHDLKNPLAVISGYASILESKMDHESREYRAVNNISISVNQIGRLLDSLIQLSLLESNQLKPDLNRYNYSLFADDYLKRFEATADYGNVKLSWHCANERMIVKADLLWLERILGNLIQNAFKYNKKDGSINVNVYADREYVYTQVTDTGVGIPESKLGLIFSRKYQAHKELNKGGYGLGLSIVKDMLDIIGGTISVESQPDIGTKFTYSIPLHTDQNTIAKNEETGTAVVAERRNGPDRRKENRMRELITDIDESLRMNSVKKELSKYEGNKKDRKSILICDDNMSHLQLLAEKLGENYNLLLAENGQIGLEKFSSGESSINAILTDVKMPVMDGIMFCRKIRTNEKLKQVP
ncbi:MAG: ATP-binding protein, partial [Fibrobacter sp.]|nr:ATP-binding protein [Fibrobacter sp.]